MRREGSIKVSHCYDKIFEQKPHKAFFWLTVQDTVRHGGKTHANSSVLDDCLGNGHSHSEGVLPTSVKQENSSEKYPDTLSQGTRDSVRVTLTLAPKGNSRGREEAKEGGGRRV